MSGSEAEGAVLSRAQTVRLIRAYGARRQLWDVADARYFHRAARARAWRDIALALRAPAPDLKKKLVSLMGSYRREKSREKQSVAAGHPPEMAYKSKWYGYQHFKFLADRTPAPPLTYSQEPDEPEPEPEPGRDLEPDPDQPPLDTIKVEFTDYNEEETPEIEYNDGMDSPAPESPASLAPRPAPRPDPLLEPASCGAGVGAGWSQLHDACSTFGHYIASEMRKYDAVTLAHVKHAINGVIFEANIGRLPRPPPRPSE